MSDQEKFYAGIDLGGTGIKAGLFGSDGKLLKEGERRTPASAQAILSAVGELCQELTGEEGGGLSGLGIGAAGVLDQEMEMILESPNLPDDFRSFPLRKRLEESLKVPVVLDNDASAAALGEYHFGAGRGSKSLICFTLGTGIGGGIVLEGRLWRGATNAAGELGHMCIDPEGPICGCGGRGCLEAFCSTQAILERAEDFMARQPGSVLNELEELTPHTISQVARAGDRAAIKVWEETGRYLGVGIGNILNIFNPEVVVLSGGVSEAGDLILKPALRSAKEVAFEAPFRAARIQRGELGNRAGITGAACLLLKA